MPAPGEPLWLAEDLAWAKALLQLDAERCSGCGHPIDETTDPDSEGRYTAVLARCHACATATSAIRSFGQDGDTTGIQVRVRRDT